MRTRPIERKWKKDWLYLETTSDAGMCLWTERGWWQLGVATASAARRAAIAAAAAAADNDGNGWQQTWSLDT